MLAPDSLRFLYLDLNSFFASVEQQRHPALRGKPVIVVPVLTDYTCAIAASYEAKAFGIKTGTNVGEAKRLCPDLAIVLASHEAYVQAHHQVHAAVERCVPVSEVASIDEFVCELKANEAPEAKARALAAQIKRTIAQEVGPHVRCSIGLSSNRYLAKIATDLQKPDGLTVLYPSEVETRLHDLPLRDLPGIGYHMEARLLAQGIRRFADLFALQPKQMRAVWHSVGGERLYYKLRGHELAEFSSERRTVGHSHILAPQWRPVKLAESIGRRLTLKAAARLRRMEHHAGAMLLSARIEQGARIATEMRFSPICDSPGLLAQFEAGWQLLFAKATPALRIKKVSITLHRLSPADQVQPDLFSATMAPRQKKNEALSVAMDTLNARFGRDAVTMGILPKRSGFSGTKIAFTRVPEMDEFHE
jgi:DNA polymerase-4